MHLDHDRMRGVKVVGFRYLVLLDGFGKYGSFLGVPWSEYGVNRIHRNIRCCKNLGCHCLGK